VQIVAITFFVLWLLSLWLLVIERRRPIHARVLQSLPLISGTLLFLVLSLAGIMFLRLLLAD
jgi:hypothetical protein